ncbi:MAG TPA: creatininase family protein [Candidatus Limnocylindrales bacterium]|nr:creatininase family protein [Candidatus Limnocylindrales bacterium]
MTRRWAELTSPELAATIAREPVVIVPLGSMEQHGPHLPVSTDTDIGLALAEASAEEAATRDIPVLVTPPIWSGYSPHHMDLAGTITVEQDTFIALVGDVVTSLHRHGVRHVLLLNSHGGNMALAKVAADRVAVRLGVSPVVCTYWHLVGEEVAAARRSPPGGMGHACELETSLQLHLEPSRVRSELLAPAVVPAESAYHHVEMFAASRVSIYRPFTSYSESGVIGDPTLATPELGKRIFGATVGAIVAVCEEMRRGVL